MVSRGSFLEKVSDILNVDYINVLGVAGGGELSREESTAWTRAKG